MSDSSVTPWTVACPAPLSVRFSLQNPWERVAISFSRGSAQLGAVNLCPLRWQAGSLPLNTLRSPGWGYHLLNLKRTSPSYLHPLKYCLKIGDRTFFQFSCSVVSDSLWPHGLQHTRPPCPSPTPGVDSNSCPLSPWCHPTISSSVVPFSSCLQSFPASGSFKMSHLFASGGQSTGLSASTSVLPVNIQDWFPLGLTGLIFLHPKGLSRVFFNGTVQKDQFFGAHLSL